MNIQKMLKQAQQMQADMAKAQQNLAAHKVEASVGGGRVVVTANGTGDIEKIKINKSVVDPEDVEILEDLVLTAVRQAQENARALGEKEMSKVTSGMGLPKGFGI